VKVEIEVSIDEEVYEVIRRIMRATNNYRSIIVNAMLKNCIRSRECMENVLIELGVVEYER